MPTPSFLSAVARRVGPLRAALVAVAGVGAILSGLAGYWNTYLTVRKTSAIQPVAVLQVSPWSPTDPRMGFGVLAIEAPQGDAVDEDYASSLTDALIADLSRERFIGHVPTRAQIASAKPKGDPVALARALHVDFLVQGKVHRLEGEFESDFSLLDGQTGEEIGHDHFQESISARHDPIRFAPVTTSTRFYRIAFEREIQRSRAVPDAKRDARDLVYLAWLVVDKGIKEQTDEAVGYIERAAQKEPGNLFVLGTEAVFLGNRAFNGYSSDIAEDIHRSRALIDFVLSRDPKNFEALRAKAHLYSADHRWEDALAVTNQIYDDNPVFAASDANKAEYLLHLGRAEETLSFLDSWPRHIPKFEGYYGPAFLQLGRNAEAAASYRSALTMFTSRAYGEGPARDYLLGLAAAEATSNPAQAKRTLGDFLMANPTIRTVSDLGSMDDHELYSEQYLAALIAGLRAAGMPE